MKIGFVLYNLDVKSKASKNLDVVIEQTRVLCNKGADIILTPEEAIFDFKLVEEFWEKGQHGNAPEIKSTEEQLYPFKQLAKKHKNVLGIGFVEFDVDKIYDSYALVTAKETTIRRKSIFKWDYSMIGGFDNSKFDRLAFYENQLKPNGKPQDVWIEGKRIKIFPAICSEVNETIPIADEHIPADVLVVASYGLPKKFTRRFYKALEQKKLMKTNGLVAVCDGYEPYAALMTNGHLKTSFATKPKLMEIQPTT